MKILHFTLILLILGNLSCLKETETNLKSSERKNDFSKREGRQIFSHYCSPCHGENGEGYGKYFAYGLEPRPPDFTAPDFLQNRVDSILYLSISKGSVELGKSNLCPPWGNTFYMEEINFLISYIKYINTMANFDGTLKSKVTQK